MTDRIVDPPRAARPIVSIQPEWRTARTSLRVLVVIHSVTAATRIGDLFPIFQDQRVQLFCTQTSDAVFCAGVSEFMHTRGFLRLTWEQALTLEFDIIITASLGDSLYELKSPILRLPHGNGYNKLWNQGTKEPRNQGTKEPRNQGTKEPRNQGTKGFRVV